MWQCLVTDYSLIPEQKYTGFIETQNTILQTLKANSVCFYYQYRTYINERSKIKEICGTTRIITKN